MKTIADRISKNEGVAPDKEHLLQVRIPEQMFRDLRSIGGARGTSASGLVREIVDRFLAMPENRRAS